MHTNDWKESAAVVPVTHLACTGCGAHAPAGKPYPFRCPDVGRDDDTDHVLDRIIDLKRADPDGSSFRGDEPNPFLRYRRLFHSYHESQARGLTEDEYRETVEKLDAAVAFIEGHGFRATPFGSSEALSRVLGFTSPDAVWIKDETGNVAGSHKARHLMGVMIWLEVMDRLGLGSRATPLAIASCGNAALAAAVVARAAGRPLEVFLPHSADTGIVQQLHDLDAHLTACPRSSAMHGDPCYLGFLRAVKGGALPFTCQGNENGLIIEGGETLAYEMISRLVQEGKVLDRLFIQVGGGALASACIRAHMEAVNLKLLKTLPRIHAVQTESGFPLCRAYDRVVERILARLGEEVPTFAEVRANLIRTRVPAEIVSEALQYAATHRSEFMQPWETEPRSIATGILDDETYDWLAVVRGMIATGGFPVIVPEDTLKEAHSLAVTTTSIPVDPTGSAGLAGCLHLQRAGVVKPDETVALLFTGVQR